MGKCVFNPKWASSYKWVIKAEDKFKAYCTCCKKLIDLGKMGEGALKSHEKCEKHKANMRSVSSVAPATMEAFRIPPPPQQAQATPSCSTVQPIQDFFVKNDVLKAEVLWTFHTIVNHNSSKPNEGVSNLFKLMFLDSRIADKFQCGERKTAYFTVFGIAEYLKSLIIKDVTGQFVVLFDESLNKKSQAKQMDFHVRFWKGDKVVTQYLGSVFIGHVKAVDLVEHFNKGMQDLLPVFKNMLQISMDGPNVNWKFFSLISTQMELDHNVKLINIGSCGLHIMHNAFKAGALCTKWDVSSFLSSLYYLFKDSPARREDYQRVTGSSTMPLKFVSHRWMENVPICDRAILILPHIGTYTSKVQSKELEKPGCKSYEVVTSKLKDKLIKAKLEFFRYIAMFIQPFLGNYQTDRPMTPFLMNDLSSIIKDLMKTIVKSDVLKQAEGVKFLSIDLDDKDTFTTHFKIEIVFSTEKALKEAVKDSKVSELQVMEFKVECRDFVVKLLKKLLDKCPVTYSLIRNMSALDPREMVANASGAKSKMKRLLSYLVSVQRVQERECDEVMRQFSNFIDLTIPSVGSEKFASFSHYSDRIDEFFTQVMSEEHYEKLLGIIKLCLVLSHGQATVERGFSVNKEIEVENLKDQSIVAQRIICDYVQGLGGVMNVPLTKELLQSVTQSRHKYEQYLSKQREKTKTDAEKRKRKHLEDSISELKQQAKQAKLDMESLSKSADEYAVRAEKERNFTFISKSNAMREKAKEKCTTCNELETKLNDKLKELKSI